MGLAAPLSKEVRKGSIKTNMTPIQEVEEGRHHLIEVMEEEEEASSSATNNSIQKPSDIILNEEIDVDYVPSEIEVLEHAMWLGMDFTSEIDLFWRKKSSKILQKGMLLLNRCIQEPGAGDGPTSVVLDFLDSTLRSRCDSRKL